MKRKLGENLDIQAMDFYTAKKYFETNLTINVKELYEFGEDLNKLYYYYHVMCYDVEDQCAYINENEFREFFSTELQSPDFYIQFNDIDGNDCYRISRKGEWLEYDPECGNFIAK